MTDKEVRAIAIKEVTYADMIAIGATEEIAMVANCDGQAVEIGVSKKGGQDD